MATTGNMRSATKPLTEKQYHVLAILRDGGRIAKDEGIRGTMRSITLYNELLTEAEAVHPSTFHSLYNHDGNFDVFRTSSRLIEHYVPLDMRGRVTVTDFYRLSAEGRAALEVFEAARAAK